MSDNVIKSTDVNPEKPKTVKKTTKKTNAINKADAAPNGVKEGYKIIIFESGTSYSSGDIRFTSDSRVQEIPAQEAERLLELDNFRLPNQFEIEDYFNSRED